MAVHDAECPACGSSLKVIVSAHSGGMVEESVGLAVVSKQSETSAALADAEKALKKAQAEAVAAAKAVLAQAKEEK